MYERASGLMLGKTQLAIQIFFSFTACYKRTHRGEIEACSPLPFDCLSMFVALRRRLMARGRSTTERLQPSWPGGWCGVAERLPTLLYCSIEQEEGATEQHRQGRQSDIENAGLQAWLGDHVAAGFLALPRTSGLNVS